MGFWVVFEKNWKVSVQSDVHEFASINRIYGFYNECKRGYNIRLWNTFTDWYNWKSVSDSEFLSEIFQSETNYSIPILEYSGSWFGPNYLSSNWLGGNRFGFGFGPAFGLTPKKGNHYKSFLIIVKLLFQKLFILFKLVTDKAINSFI